MKRIHTLRGRLTAIAFVVALIAITVLTVAFNLLLARSLDHDADHRLRSQAAAATTTVVEHGGRLTLRESPDDAVLDRQVWVYDGRRAIERPAAPVSVQHAADALVGHTRRVQRPAGPRGAALRGADQRAAAAGSAPSSPASRSRPTTARRTWRSSARWRSAPCCSRRCSR